MSQIEKSTPKRFLFKAAMEEHHKLDGEQKLFWYRLNRWRVNSANMSTYFKNLRIKGIVFGTIACSIIYDYTWNFYEQPYSHH